MTLITEAHRVAMLANGQRFALEPAFDPVPVVKISAPFGRETWLLWSLETEDPDTAWGLYDFGFGTPDLGTVRIFELEAFILPFWLWFERDLSFTPSKTIGQCAEEARLRSCILA